MGGMETRGWMEWIDEDFGKGEKYTEEFTSSGELRDGNRLHLEFHMDSGLCPTNKRIEILLKCRGDV